VHFWGACRGPCITVCCVSYQLMFDSETRNNHELEVTKRGWRRKVLAKPPARRRTRISRADSKPAKPMPRPAQGIVGRWNPVTKLPCEWKQRLVFRDQTNNVILWKYNSHRHVAIDNLHISNTPEQHHYHAIRLGSIAANDRLLTCIVHDAPTHTAVNLAHVCRKPARLDLTCKSSPLIS